MSFKQSHPKFWTRGRHLLVTVLLVWGMAVGQLVADESNRAEVPDAKGVEFFEERILPLLKQPLLRMSQPRIRQGQRRVGFRFSAWLGEGWNIRASDRSLQA